MTGFWRREDGNVAIEGLLGGVLLLGWFMAAYEFYDAFRIKARISSASYTMADLISRQKAAIGPAYIDGTKRLFDQFVGIRATDRSWLRITLISCPATPEDMQTCDGVSKPMRLDQSHATGGHTALTQETLDARAHRIPMMAAGDSAVVLETVYTYLPVFGIGDRDLSLGGSVPIAAGLTSRLTFHEFIVTRPRGPRTVWNADH
ncbi:hypothetical protein [Paenirhodobacter populi]|uniref:Pilus assembly protein n=1 Tax=Paenirhodobacter populi TaxID=2306993 RepID=A0A443J2S4_9RHOB|nr:hypothetical protein [Sinirhodobacter populi]RWR10750.1 hypothetical protein D2T32_02465 [Sinirhodobacter populi]RWR14767.1 hypothetical protein D2T33_02080 [Sinirhodobacter populi]